MAILYVIRDWPKHYENNRTRELKVLDWIRLPVKMDGDGYTELVDHPDGAGHFGVWIALLEVAARCETRGTLLRGDRNGVRRPHDVASLSRLTRLPVAILEAAIARLLDIGWIDAQPFGINELDDSQQESRTRPAPTPHPAAVIPQESGGVPARARACDSRETREDKTREEERREEGSAEGRTLPEPRPTSGAPPAPTSGAQPRTPKAPKFDPATVPIPAELDRPGFREVWGRRLAERAEPGAGTRPSKSQIEAQLQKLVKLARARGLPLAIGCVERATEGRHEGVVFREDFAERGRNGSAATLPRPAPEPLTVGQLRDRAVGRVQQAALSRAEALPLLDRIADLQEPAEFRDFLREHHLPPISELGA